MCLFQDKVAVKRVARFSPSPHREPRSLEKGSEKAGGGGGAGAGGEDQGLFSSSPYYTQFDALMGGEDQCRSCFDQHRPPGEVNSYEREMLANGCIKEGEDCRCGWSG